LHPVHVVKYVAPEWKAEEWKPAVAEWKAEEWKPAVEEWKEPEAPANYDFNYDVHDPKTGDIKKQSETAVNGAVKGSYSFIEADGFRRTVDYTADDHSGFQATVKREPTHYKIPVAEHKIVLPAAKIISHEPHWW
jgi:hypothetical protein